MNCVCGYHDTGKYRLNRHRRQCSQFWQSVYDEMKRIALARYGRVVAISKDEWDSYRPLGYPNCKMMYEWGKPWRQVQEESGHGVSIEGRGAAVLKGPPIQQPRWDSLASIPDYTGKHNEEYLALPEGGMNVCVETYQRTGRMFLR